MKTLISALLVGDIGNLPSRQMKEEMVELKTVEISSMKAERRQVLDSVKFNSFNILSRAKHYLTLSSFKLIFEIFFLLLINSVKINFVINKEPPKEIIQL